MPINLLCDQLLKAYNFHTILIFLDLIQMSFGKQCYFYYFRCSCFLFLLGWMETSERISGSSVDKKKKKSPRTASSFQANINRIIKCHVAPRSFSSGNFWPSIKKVCVVLILDSIAVSEKFRMFTSFICMWASACMYISALHDSFMSYYMHKFSKLDDKCGTIPYIYSYIRMLSHTRITYTNFDMRII